MKLYLIRHPQPDIGEGLCYGGTDIGVPADRLHAAAAALAPLLPAGVPVYTSPLRRCMALAALLAPDRSLVDERLRELHFGAWEMRAWDDIPRAEIDAWAADPVDYQPGGGDSVLKMAARVRAFYLEMRQRQISSVVVICHAGTMRLLEECQRHADTREIALAAAATPRRFGYGGLVVLRDCS